MKTFTCPKCSHTVTARGVEVAHRCRMNRNRITRYEEAELTPVRVVGEES